MDDDTMPSEQLPKSIGRFQVTSALGFGAMGAVYKAFDPLIKRTLAIKTIRLDIPRTSPQYKSFIDRFYHEARISGTLSHPHIVTLFDIGEDGGLPYLAMEYIEGQPVAALLESGHKFKPERVIAIASQVASALDYAHGRGVIHRDIKPSNLMIYGEDKVKVTDFGIAKLVDTEMTQSGTLLGTPSYMSPEQAMGDKLDGRSDIFSLGVCCFEMLSGEQPFPGVNVTSILYKLVHVDPVEPANLEMNGLVPQKWHEVFGRVLAKKPEDRYQTATAFVQDLEFCLGSWFGGLGSAETIVVSGAEAAALTGGAVPISTEAMPVYVEPATPPAPRDLAVPPAHPEVPAKPAAEVGTDTVPPKLPVPAASFAGSGDEPGTVSLKGSSIPAVVAATGLEDEARTMVVRRGSSPTPAPEARATDDSSTMAFRAPKGWTETPKPSGQASETAPPSAVEEGTVVFAASDLKAQSLSEVPPSAVEEGTVVLPVPPPVAGPALPGPDSADEGTVVFSVPPVISSRPPDACSPAPGPSLVEEGTVMLSSVPGMTPYPLDEGSASSFPAEEGTVVLQVPPPSEAGFSADEGTVVLAVPMAHAATGVGAPAADDEGTLVSPALSSSKVRTAGIADRATGASAPPPVPPLAVPTPRPGSVASPRTDPGLSGTGRRKGAGPPIGLILGGAALLFFMAVAFVGWIAYRKLLAPPAEPTPAPEVASTPTAPPLEASTPAPAVTHGLLRVESTPGGGAVFVDGQEQQGTTPVEIPAVALGTHEVKVQLKGYEPSTETIALTVDAPTAELRFTLTKAQPTSGTVTVTSTPVGATIKVDGKPLGTTPRSSLRLRPGTHTVELALDGYEAWSGRVEVKAGEAATVEAELKAKAKPKPVATPTPEAAVDPNRVYENVPGEVDLLAKRTSGSFAEWPRGVQQLRSNDSASVSVQFVVTESGEVQDPKVTESSGRPQVDESVLKAVRTFRYNPAQKQGIKVKVRVTFKQTFRAG